MHRGRRSRLAQPYQPGRGLGLKHPSRRRGKGSTRQSLREPASEQSLGSPGSRPGSRTIFHGEGYQEGYAEGSHVGVIEGRRYGALHGAKIGSEIGYYLGFALTWQRLLHRSAEEKPSKKIKALESLIGMIQKYPYEDPTYDKLHEDLEKIRGKFKQVCSSLNIQSDFRINPERSALTF
nr:protein LTO1 homolog isoform X1 [Chrysemys picta bellii]